MTLLELTDFWKDISLRHKDVQEFQVGSNYDSATNTDNKYPLVFYELPYSITYNQDKPIDTIIFSLNVFLESKVDSIKDDYEAISLAKEIGDAIMLKAESEAIDFKINSINALSVREYTDDSVAGIRYDISLDMKREVCDVNNDDNFLPQ